MNSRARARLWPYPRRNHYVKDLQQSAATWFAAKEFRTNHDIPYLLARWEDWPSNIILSDVADYIRHLRDNKGPHDAFPLHKYIHHGLSSQAMLFNLIGPLMVRDDYRPLKLALEQTGIDFPTGKVRAEFECEDREVFAEDSGQPTSIDLVVRGDDTSETLYIECKLSEAEFGGCSVFEAGDCSGQNPADRLDACYLEFIGRRYWQHLKNHGFMDAAVGKDSCCILANHYQFFRELIFAVEKGGRFVLIYDERNPTFVCQNASDPTIDRGLLSHLMGMVPSQLKPCVGQLSLQGIVSCVKATGDHEDWVGEFERKYGLA